MISMERGKLILVRLFPGEDLLEELDKVCKKHRVESAVVLSGIGMLREVELCYFKGRGKYSSLQVDGPLELVMLSGNISQQGKGYFIHLHAALASEKNMFGGHLGGGKVNVTNEIVLLKTGIKLLRLEEKESGLKGLYFEKRRRR